jgi:hypothetical protein
MIPSDFFSASHPAHHGFTRAPEASTTSGATHGDKAMAANIENGNGRRGIRLRVAIWVFAACLLLLPWVAMRFTRDVNWTGRDFLTFGTMLFVACGTYELGARMTRNTAYRAAVGVAVAAAFLLVWVSLAVGIIGETANPANLMFAGVLVVGIVGSLVARFKPRGMSRALVATAFAEALVAMIAVVGQLDDWGPTVGLSGFLAAMWLASAWLFGKAAEQRLASSAR